jgi:hypothetical protein
VRQILFEVSPAWLPVCILCALLIAAVLYYRARAPWSRRLNTVLFVMRFVLIFFLLALFLRPLIRYTFNRYEKPVFAILLDNSVSVKMALDSAEMNDLIQDLGRLQDRLVDNGFEVPLLNLRARDVEAVSFTEQYTNLSEALRLVAGRFEGRKLEGVLLISDGIYNAGLSPADMDYAVPVYTVGIGDTVPKPDLAVGDVVYNKVVFQGNRFPIRADIRAVGFEQQPVTVSLLYRGRVVGVQSKVVPPPGFFQADFLVEAPDEGLQRWELRVEEHPREFNTRNNRAAVFVEVKKGKRKVLILAAAPHPDIRALRLILEKNIHYDIITHIPQVQEYNLASLRTEDIDLLVLYQLPDQRGRLRDEVQRFSRLNLPRFYFFGSTSDITFLMQQGFPVGYDQVPRQWDEATPALNPQFSRFSLSEEAPRVLSSMPPVAVRSGKIRTAPSANIVLYQQIGNVVTDRPLLVYFSENERKTAIMFGEGLFRWRMHEFSRTGRTDITDEIFLKFIQLLTTPDEKKRFTFAPLKPEFTTGESIAFECQMYNEIFEPVFGRNVEVVITDEQNRKREYNFMTDPFQSRFTLPGLEEGVYRYAASADLDGDRQTIRGQFLVSARSVELQNLTADFSLLRKLSEQTGGKFFKPDERGALFQEMESKKGIYIIRSEEQFASLLNLHLWLIFLLAWAAVEWILRKYSGGY